MMISTDRLDRRKRFIDMAAGRIPADLLLTNCRIVDVFSQSLQRGSLAVGDGRIVGIGEYEALQIKDAGGRYVLPGLIDAHAHIESSMLTPAKFAAAVAVCGTTTVIADPHEIANVLGSAGIRYMLEASTDLPVCIKFMLPSCVPASEFEYSGATLGAADLAEFIADERVLGLGEVMNYPGVVANDTDLLLKILLAEEHGKIVDGHAPGLWGDALSAYAAAGVKNDHECVSAAELRSRIQRGMYVYIREGTAARNLSSLVQGMTPGLSRRCCFCTDDREAQDIVHRGHMNSLLQLAVANGLDPITAVTMATLNPSECYGLKNKGGLAPGRDADIVIVDDLVGFKVRDVYTRGQHIVERGRLRDYQPCTSGKPGLSGSVRLTALSADAFRLQVHGGKARAIEVVPNSLITKNRIVDVDTGDDGIFSSARNPGLNQIAVVERHGNGGQVGLGILKNYGLSRGAIATTIAHDAHNIVVAGDNVPDMFMAVKELEKIGGGIVVVYEGAVTGRLSLPIAGLMCDLSVEEVCSRLEEMTIAAHQDLHVNALVEPFMTLSFLSLSVIPELKITAGGLLDVEKMQVVSVSVPE